MSKIYKFKEVDNKDFILDLTIPEIKQELLKGTFSVLDLVSVYCQRSYTIGRELGLSADEIFDTALKTAALYDIQLQEAIKNGTTDQLPQLFGIPFSVKDQIELVGTRATIALNLYANTTSQHTNPYVQFFLNEGAIPIVKGNVPQGVISIFTQNTLWGTARNPHDKERTCGGSSGGDAGLVSSSCAQFGLGSDIGGSIRVPCHFTGIKGIRFTSERVTRKYLKTGLPNCFFMYPYIKTALGPMSRSMDDLLVLSKIMLNGDVNSYDSAIGNCPFNDQLYQKALNKKITIGYFETLDNVPATKAMMRTVRLAKETLEQQGYTLVPFKLTWEEQQEGQDISTALLAGEGQVPLFDNMFKNYEEPSKTFTLSAWFYRQNSIFQGFVKMMMTLFGQNRLVRKVNFMKRLSKKELESIIYRRHVFVSKMEDKWKALGIDAVISPTYLSSAFKIKNGYFLSNLIDYTAFWNTLNFPGGVLPITEVMPGEDQGYEDQFNDKWSNDIKDDIKGSVGMPLSVQVVSWGFQDEIALAIMKVLDDAIQFKKKPQL